MLKSKIHRATTTGADIAYEGSITLDPILMEAADIVAYEQVHVLDVDNGARLTTYAIEGTRGSGDVIINGAAARLVARGDTVIIIAYEDIPEDKIASHHPSLVYVDRDNQITHTSGALAAAAPSGLPTNGTTHTNQQSLTSSH
jgi:aspartate 1-decarboxylase